MLSNNQKINYASTVTSTQADRKPFKRFRLADAHDNDSHDQGHVAALDTERFQNAVDDNDNGHGDPLVAAQGSVSVTSTSLLLDLIPQDVLMTNICCYLTDASDFYSLQMSCKKFQEVSNEVAILKKIDLAGEAKTGKGSILFQVNQPSVGVQKLYKFAAAGNQQAVYMTGMIAAYCHGDKVGVTLLRQNANKGCLRSAYTLGLILRDRNREESESYLQRAISVNYLPACQELLPSQEVKNKFGDLDSNTLKNFFDPISLNRLLGRTYLQSAGVRSVSTSHCWNPCCGRWALKATQNNSRGPPPLQYPSKYLPALSPSLEHSLLQLVEEDVCDSLPVPSASASSTSNGNTFIKSGSDGAAISTCIPCVEKIDKVDCPKSKRRTCIKSGSDSAATSTAIACVEKIDKVACPRSKSERSFYVSRMKMCSSCRRAKYCSKLCQVYDWRSGQHKVECHYL